MSKIPTQIENPKGLHQRYQIRKIVSTDMNIAGATFVDTKNPFRVVDADPNAEYFVMRLDTDGSDLKHIAACRIGIHAYADAIYPHLPELAIDLKTRYPLLK